MLSELTVGVLGYGRIGQRVALMASAIGSTVVATKRHGPFVPPPSPLKWLSSDNDRLYREADVVVVTVPGTGHKETEGIINTTSLGLMRPHALVIPISAGPIDFLALEKVLRTRPSMRAVVDVWPQGCWHYPNVTLRDAAFWRWSVGFVAGNLDALSQGRPLKGVVRNASHAAQQHDHL